MDRLAKDIKLCLVLLILLNIGMSVVLYLEFQNAYALDRIQSYAAEPLHAEWMAETGITYHVLLDREPGWTDDEWETAFEAKVVRNAKRNPPVRR